MTAAEDIAPWYKEFWLWFIVALPATVVVACIYTVILAFKHEDSLVVDDYYKDGMGINRVLAQDEAAVAMALRATVAVDALVGEVRINLDGNLAQWPEVLELQWFHPTNMQRDMSMLLNRTHDGRYLGQLQQSANGRWYVQLSSESPSLWRLKTEIKVNGEAQFQLGSSLSSSTGS